MGPAMVYLAGPPCLCPTPVVSGVPLVIIPNAARTDVRYLTNLLAKHRITRLVVVPSLLSLLASPQAPSGGPPLPLRYCTISGEALPWDLAAAAQRALPKCTLLNLYGCTEIAADVTCYVVRGPEGPSQDQGLPLPAGAAPRQRFVPIGRPISHTDVQVLVPESGRSLHMSPLTSSADPPVTPSSARHPPPPGHRIEH